MCETQSIFQRLVERTKSPPVPFRIMNKVTVKLLIPLPKFPREKEMNIDFHEKMTVLKLLEQIAVGSRKKLIDSIYNRQSGSIKPQFGISVNGTHINFLNGLGTLLKNGDTVTIFLVIGGG